MKVYLHGLNCIAGFMNITEKKREIFIELPEMYLGELKATEDMHLDPIKKAVFVYDGMMPVYKFKGVE
jgi:hypothetical protein